MGEIWDKRKEDKYKVKRNQVKLAKLVENCLRVMISPYSEQKNEKKFKKIKAKIRGKHYGKKNR